MWNHANTLTPMIQLLTTPIFYVNASPHLGHLYSIVLTDVARRWKLLNGVKCVMSTGTDEHGTKVDRAAKLRNMSPQQHADLHSAEFRKLASLAGAETVFVRTTDPLHRAHATDLWKRLVDNNMVYKGKHSGYYCVSDECFYTKDELELNDKNELVSKESKHTVEWLEETNWFFKLNSMQKKLVDLMKTNPSFILPRVRHDSILKELKKTPLADLSISRPRSRVPWGVPVPGTDAENLEENVDTMYVWFEALANYLTAATMHGCTDNFELTHVVGKDIQRFHTVFWPAFLMAAGLKTPKQVVVHGHWTADGVKMSKSLGNVIDPFKLIEELGVDTVRYALCFDSTLDSDSAFSVERAIERRNVNLVNKWSNLASRVCSKKFDAIKALETVSKANLPNSESRTELVEACTGAAEIYEFGKYLHILNDAAIKMNEKLHTAAPWEDPNSTNSLLAVAEALDTCRVIAILLLPVCPTYSKRMLDSLGVKEERRTMTYAAQFADLDYTPAFEPVVTRI